MALAEGVTDEIIDRVRAEFARRLAALDPRLSQRRLAILAGVSNTTVSIWEGSKAPSKKYDLSSRSREMIERALAEVEIARDYLAHSPDH